MAGTIVLIDGMYLLFSSYYSNRNMRTLKGEPTGATFGFVTRIESIIRDVKPHRLAVAMDSREKTFRHLLFEPYKAKRLAPPEDLILQLPQVKEYLSLRSIPLFEMPGFEADDIIAATAKAEAQNGNDVLIFSADKDLFQLVGGSIYIYHPKFKQKLDSQGIKEFFGIAPGQIVDFLSLTGDSSDNIPGVPGIGEKTAQKIITQFGTIQNLLENLDKLDEKTRTKIDDNMESLRLARQLIDFSFVPPLSSSISIDPFQDNVSSPLLEFFRRLSFNSLVKRFEESSPSIEKASQVPREEITYTIVKDKNQLSRLKQKIQEIKTIAFDLETTALEFYNSQIVGLSISFENEGYYIPFLFSKLDSGTLGIDIRFEDFRQELAPLFADPTIHKTGHNLKFDILHLKHHGIEVNGAADDSMIMSYLLYPNRRAHHLKELTYEFFKYRQVEYRDLTGKGKNQQSLTSVDIEYLSKYCIDDSYFSLRLVNVLGERIREKELTNLYRQIEMPLVDVLMEMEYAGVKVDIEFLKKAEKIFQERICAVEEEIFKMADFRFNLNSSQQLGELLFDKMNLPFHKRTKKTKSYSTDNEVLEELKNVPIIASIIEYRTYKKLLSTYIIGLMESVDTNHRVHTSFNQTVTATGRLSSSNPNLQNIPVGETGGINVRDAFVSENDLLLLAADYSQIELRVMAHFSQDPNLLEAFKNDFDIHQHTADTVFGNDLFSDAKEKRRRAKIINFSVLYGSGPFSLSKELGVGYKEAKEFIDMYFEKYSGVKRFIEDVIAAAEKEPEVKTISGRRRDIPEIASANKTVKENGKRMAINTIIQGSAADIIKIAMLNIHKQLKASRLKSRLLMQVHDELVFEYPPEEEAELCRIVRSEMENAGQLQVPLKVVLKKGKTWGSLQNVKI